MNGIIAIFNGEPVNVIKKLIIGKNMRIACVKTKNQANANFNERIVIIGLLVFLVIVNECIAYFLNENGGSFRDLNFGLDIIIIGIYEEI